MKSLEFDIGNLICSIDDALLQIQAKLKITTSYDTNLQWLSAHVQTESLLFIYKLKQLREAIQTDGS